jgi:hypothetical protein
MSEFEAERARIGELAAAISQLKIEKKPFDAELKEMLALKVKAGQTTNKKDAGKGKLNLKTPKVIRPAGLKLAQDSLHPPRIYTREPKTTDHQLLFSENRSSIRWRVSS